MENRTASICHQTGLRPEDVTLVSAINWSLNEQDAIISRNKRMPISTSSFSITTAAATSTNTTAAILFPFLYEVCRRRRRRPLDQMRRMGLEDITGWWHDVVVDSCEDQTEIHIAVYRLDTECRLLVTVAHAPGDRCCRRNPWSCVQLFWNPSMA